MKELEDSEGILSEFKKKAKELDDSLEQERNSQKMNLEERLSARRKKHDDDLDK